MVRKGGVQVIYGKLPALFLSAVSSEKNGSINSAIAGYILGHLEAVREMGIQELAGACHVSAASVSRFCKEVGFQSYAELRHVLETTQLDFNSLFPRETPEGRRGKVAQEISSSIQAAGQGVDMAKLRQLCREMRQYRRVAAFGILKAETAAICLQCDLLMQGKRIYTNVSFPQQMEYLFQAGEEDLILLFSWTGSYFEYQDLRGREEALRAPRIWMVSGLDKPFPPYVDQVLLYPSQGGHLGHPFQLLTVASLIAQEYSRAGEEP